jgi:hypothetical protein
LRILSQSWTQKGALVDTASGACAVLAELPGNPNQDAAFAPCNTPEKARLSIGSRTAVPAGTGTLDGHWDISMLKTRNSVYRL